jgi:hypothetical protein
MSNNGAVDANGNVSLYLGTKNSPIQYFSENISFKVSLYDTLGETIPR